MKQLLGNYEAPSDLEILQDDMQIAVIMIGSLQLDVIKRDSEIKRLKTELQTRYGALEVENSDLHATIARMVADNPQYGVKRNED